MKFPNKWPGKEKGPEAVKGAIIVYNGESFTNKNHALALTDLLATFPDYEPGKEEARGWLTSNGRIVSEEEAQQIEVRRKLLSGEETEIMRDPESSLFKEKNE